MKTYFSIIGLAIASVATAGAQTIQMTATTGSGSQVGEPLKNLLGVAQQLVAQAAPLLIGVAVLCLFVGVIYFLWKGRTGDEAGRKGAMQFIIMSIVGIFVMVSIWGLVAFLGSIIGVGQGGGVPTPVIPVTPRVQ